MNYRTSNFAKVWHSLPCWIFRSHGLITWLQVLNHDPLFSVPSCLLLDDLIKETTCNVMVNHLQSHVTRWSQYASHVKVRGTSSKIDVPILLIFFFGGGRFFRKSYMLEGCLLEYGRLLDHLRYLTSWCLQGKRIQFPFDICACVLQ